MGGASRRSRLHLLWLQLFTTRYQRRSLLGLELFGHRSAPRINPRHFRLGCFHQGRGFGFRLTCWQLVAHGDVLSPLLAAFGVIVHSVMPHRHQPRKSEEEENWEQWTRVLLVRYSSFFLFFEVASMLFWIYE